MAKGPAMKLSTDPNAPTQQMMASPTQFLNQIGSPRLESFNNKED
jgi:hypothetical protein